MTNKTKSVISSQEAISDSCSIYHEPNHTEKSTKTFENCIAKYFSNVHVLHLLFLERHIAMWYEVNVLLISNYLSEIPAFKRLAFLPRYKLEVQSYFLTRSLSWIL